VGNLGIVMPNLGRDAGNLGSRARNLGNAAANLGRVGANPGNDAPDLGGAISDLLDRNAALDAARILLRDHVPEVGSRTPKLDAAQGNRASATLRRLPRVPALGSPSRHLDGTTFFPGSTSVLCVNAFPSRAAAPSYLA
jgi:hypothetical protein